LTRFSKSVTLYGVAAKHLFVIALFTILSLPGLPSCHCPCLPAGRRFIRAIQGIDFIDFLDSRLTSGKAAGFRGE